MSWNSTGIPGYDQQTFSCTNVLAEQFRSCTCLADGRKRNHPPSEQLLALRKVLDDKPNVFETAEHLVHRVLRAKVLDLAKLPIIAQDISCIHKTSFDQ